MVGLVFLCASSRSEDGEGERADARACPMSETKQMQRPRGPESPPCSQASLQRVPRWLIAQGDPRGRQMSSEPC